MAECCPTIEESNGVSLYERTTGLADSLSSLNVSDQQKTASRISDAQLDKQGESNILTDHPASLAIVKPVICLMNQSIVKSGALKSLKGYVKKYEVDVAFICGSKLKPIYTIDMCSIKHYKLARHDRDGKGGGICCYYRDGHNWSQLSTTSLECYPSHELMWMSIKLATGEDLSCGLCSYKPSADYDKKELIAHIGKDIEELVMFRINPIICLLGYFKKLSMDILEKKHNLVQLVEESIHEDFHDKFFTNRPDLFSVQVIPPKKGQAAAQRMILINHEPKEHDDKRKDRTGKSGSPSKTIKPPQCVSGGHSRPDVVPAVKLENPRKRNVVVKGLQKHPKGKHAAFLELCQHEFDCKPDIVSSKQLGMPEVNLILFTLKTAEEASGILSKAKALRKSSNEHVRKCVYINPYFPPGSEELKAAYELRCQRRSDRAAREAVETDSSTDYSIDSESP